MNSNSFTVNINIYNIINIYLTVMVWESTFCHKVIFCMWFNYFIILLLVLYLCKVLNMQ